MNPIPAMSYRAPCVASRPELTAVFEHHNEPDTFVDIEPERVPIPLFQPIEPAPLEMTWISILHCLAQLDSAFKDQTSRADTRIKFSIDRGLIAREMKGLIDAFLKSSSNPIDGADLLLLQYTIENILEKLSGLTPRHSEFRPIMNLARKLLLAVKKEVRSNTRRNLRTVEPDGSLDSYACDFGSFTQNLKSGIALLKTDTCGSDTALLDQISVHAEPQNIEHLTLSNLEQIRTNLAQLEKHSGAEKAKVIQFLIQAVCTQINKQYGRNLYRLKNGLNDIRDLLPQLGAGEQEISIVENLLSVTEEYQATHLIPPGQNPHLDSAFLFEISRELTELMVLLRHPSYRTDLNLLIEIQMQISTLQKLFSIVPRGVSKETEDTPGAIAIYQDNVKKIRNLEATLETVYGHAKNLGGEEWLAEFRALSLYIHEINPEFLSEETWSDIWALAFLALNALKNQRQAAERCKNGPDYVTLAFAEKSLTHLVAMCQENLSAAMKNKIKAEPITASFEFGKKDLSEMMTVLKPIINSTDEIIKGVNNSHIITRIMDVLNNSKENPLKNEDWEKIIIQLDFLIHRLEQLKLTAPATFRSINFSIENAVLVRDLCKTGSAQSAGQFDPGSKAGFLKVFREIRYAFKGYDAFQNEDGLGINAALDEVLKIVANSDPSKDDFTVEEWDFISGTLESIVRSPAGTKIDSIYDGFKINHQQDELIHNGLKIGFLKKNLDYLAFVSGAAWARQAHAAIVDHLAGIYRKEWNPAYTSLTTHTGSLSVSMPFFRIQGTAGRTSGLVTDDEGYPGELNTANGSVAVEANLGLDSIKLAKAEIDGQGSKGTYDEWDSARKYVVDHFQEMILERHNDPQVARYLARKSVPDGQVQPMPSAAIASTATVQAKEGLLPDAGEVHDAAKPEKPQELTTRIQPIVERVEISLQNISHIQKAYDLESKYISHLFSILIAIRPQHLSTFFLNEASRNTGTIKLRPLKIEQAGRLTLAYTSLSGKVAATAGPETPLANLNVSATAGGAWACAELVRNTPICAKLRRLYYREEYNDQGEIQRNKTGMEIRNEIVEKSMGLRTRLDMDAISETWKMQRKISKTAVLTTEQAASLSAFQTAELQRKRDKSMPIWSQSPIKQVLQNPMLEAHAADTAPPTKMPIEKELDALNDNLKQLKLDFKQYARFQAQMSYGDHTNAASVEAMHKKYGAINAEDCMYRFLVLNAWLYTVALDLEEQVPELSSQMKLTEDALVDLEKRMFNCKFSINKNKLNELAAFKEECLLQTKDIRLGAAAKAELIPGGRVAHGLLPQQISVLLQQRYRYHVNPLRIGEYRDVEIRLSPGLELETRSGIIDYILQQIIAQGGNDYLPKEELRKNLETYLGVGFNFTSTVVLNFRWFKPTLFPGLGYRFWNMRASISNDFTVSVATPAFFISGGYTYEKIRNTFVHEVYSTDSMLYFGLRFFHDFAIKDIVEEQGTAAISPHSYWATVKNEQIAALKDLFKNTGKAESLRRKTGGESDYSVLKELNALEAEMNKISKGRDQHKDKIDKAKKAFMDQACLFSDGDGENYEATLKAFESLMLAYSPRLITMKKKSELFKPRSFKLEAT